MNKRASGAAFQRWCKKWLEEYFPGIVVHNQTMNHVAIGPGKWISQANDILGCIDLVAIHRDQKPLFIQVTMDQHVGRKLKDLIEVPWNLEHTAIQLWIKRSPTRVTIMELRREPVMGRPGVGLFPVAEIVRRKYERV